MPDLRDFPCTSQTTISNIATVSIVVVPKLDLGIKALDEAQEDEEGGVLVKNADNNNAPRKEIILQQVIPASWTGDVVLRACLKRGYLRQVAGHGRRRLSIRWIMAM